MRSIPVPRRLAVIGRIAAAAVLVFSAVTAGDALATHGRTARGTSVAHLSLGNRVPADVEAQLDKLLPIITKPVRLRTSSGGAEFTADQLGLVFDEKRTVARAMEQPANPFTRFLSIFGFKRHVDPVVIVDREKFDKAIDAQRATLEKAAVEGGVHFEVEGDKAVPKADMPSSGLRINRDVAARVAAEQWLNGEEIVLPMEQFSPTVSAATVDATMRGPALVAAASPVTVKGRGRNVTIAPKELAGMLVFAPDGKGGLAPTIDKDKLKTDVAELKATQSKPQNAGFTLKTGHPTVVPGRSGYVVDWPATSAAIAGALGEHRTAAVAYKEIKPGLSTEQARKLGVREVVSEFSTGGFAEKSGENIRIVANKVDGAIIRPGNKFSLNNFTGPRGEHQGYVSSTIIDHGHAAKAVGGGISQFATTLYNAAYFAGLEDIDHTEHSYYISRYPEAREATVFEGAIDLVFRNNTPYGIYIETQWTPSAVTVRFWSTKTVNVESITGSRSAYTDPPKLVLPKGDECVASNGSRGFTTSNTRVITDAKTGKEISRHTRTVKYDPEPNVTCK
ncbi:VanW family protein [Gordonia sp. X0973]|uniref:VanW family protein n=1 Tax=Gordonia sp. X0973 TaxID=2742602 RepID=UPI000F51B8A9|nr:VanW family protein [Gordonia sp. X0973]QKT08680.1 VanW family protein [Gordonia sp. X0973]